MDPLTMFGIGMLASNPGVQNAATNVLGKLPIVGGLFKQDDSAQKALIAQQQKLHEELKKRAQKYALEAPPLQAAAQGMLAFNPMNQAMASMYGPQAAFQPEQLASMLQNPNPFPKDADEWAKEQGFAPTKGQGQEAVNAAFRGDAAGMKAAGEPVSLIDYRGTDPEIRARVEEYIRQKKLYDEAEKRRRDTIMGGFSQPGPGPAPLAPRAAPARARRF